MSPFVTVFAANGSDRKVSRAVPSPLAPLKSDPETPERTAFGSNLGTATVKIENYQFNLSIPVVGRVLTLPSYETTLTAESAGEGQGATFTVKLPLQSAPEMAAVVQRQDAARR